MKKIHEDKMYANELREKGWWQAQKFTQQKCAEAVMNVYKKLVSRIVKQ